MINTCKAVSSFKNTFSCKYSSKGECFLKLRIPTTFYKTSNLNPKIHKNTDFPLDFLIKHLILLNDGYPFFCLIHNLKVIKKLISKFRTIPRQNSNRLPKLGTLSKRAVYAHILDERSGSLSIHFE